MPIPAGEQYYIVQETGDKLQQEDGGNLLWNGLWEILVGSGSITPTGTLAAAKITLQVVGAGAVAIAAGLVLIVSKIVGAGIVTPASTIVRLVSKIVGEGATSIVGVLITNKITLQVVGAGAIALAGVLSRVTSKLVSGAITPAGVLSRITSKLLYGEFAAGVDTLYENSTEIGGVCMIVRSLDGKWVAQTFKPSTTHSLAKVSLFLEPYGYTGYGMLQASIRATALGKPSGTDLATSNQIDGDTITYGWWDFTMSSPVSVNSGTTYAIILRQIGGDVNKEMLWKAKNSDVYANGSIWYSDDAGGDWNNCGDWDCAFKEYASTYYGITGVLTKLTTPITAMGNGAVTMAGALSKITNKVLAGVVTMAGVLSRVTNKILAGALTPTGAISRITSKNASGSLTPTGALSKITNKIVGSGAVTLAGSLAASCLRILKLFVWKRNRNLVTIQHKNNFLITISHKHNQDVKLYHRG
jgi:hypothetical protein